MKNRILLLLLFLLGSGTTYASHILGGSIHYKCLSFGTYEVSYVVYRDCAGIPIPPTKTIEYASATCGQTIQSLTLPLVSVQEVTPVCSAWAAATTCAGGTFPGIEEYIFRDTVTLPANCPDWEFFEMECCWSNAITNINPGVNFYTQSTLNDLDYSCNSNVQFNGRGVMFANLNQPNVYAPMGVDPDSTDVLRFRLTSALQGPSFPIPYVAGYSPTNPINIVNSFDTLTGELSFTPIIAGAYVIAYDVEEYRNGDLIAVTHRVVLVYANNYGMTTPPSSSVNNVVGGSSAGDSIFVCVNTPINFDFTFTDPDAGDSIGVVHSLASQLPGVNYTITGSNPLVINIQWTPYAAGVYPVSVLVENLGCPVTLNSQVADLTIIVTDNSPQIAASDFYLCSSPAITLTASNGFLSYQWNTGATTQAINVNSAGVYTVTTTGGNCGSNVDAVEIFDEPLISAGTDTTIFLGDTIELLGGLANGLVPGRYVDVNVSNSIPVNGVSVTNLNVNNVFPTIVTTNVLEYATLNIVNPPSTNTLEVYLVTPNTNMIPLALERGGSSNTSYSNSTFDPLATDPIASYNLATSIIPQDSTFIPEGNWSHLDGSDVNGSWQLAIRQNGGTQTGVVSYFGLQFGGGFSHQWTPASGLSCTDCPNPLASPDTTTTYVLAMSNAFGCTSYDTVTVFVQPDWPVDTLYFDVAEDSLLSFCASLPTGFGALASDTVLNIPDFGSLTAGSGLGCFNYQAGPNSQLVDSLWVVACDSFGYCDTTVVIITTISCVWAGDANDDLITNNADILPIGLGYGYMGAVRPNAGVDYDCEPHRNWGIATPISNVDYKHADTDGNGIIDTDDTLAISLNWGLLHPRPGNGSASNPPSSSSFHIAPTSTIAGATVVLPIIMGDVNNPVDSAYGLAYTIFYDESMIDSGSVVVSFDSSWLGTENVDMITVHKNFYNNGQVQIGMTRTDHQPITGYGQLGTIRFTIKDDIIRRRAPFLNLTMGIGQVTFIDELENPVFVNPEPSYVEIRSRGDILGVNELQAGEVQLFPNPAKDWVQVQTAGETMQSLQLFSASGQLLRSYQPQANQFNFELNELPAGLYFVEVATAAGRSTHKLTVK